MWSGEKVGGLRRSPDQVAKALVIQRATPRCLFALMPKSGAVLSSFTRSPPRPHYFATSWARITFQDNAKNRQNSTSLRDAKPSGSRSRPTNRGYGRREVGTLTSTTGLNDSWRSRLGPPPAILSDHARRRLDRSHLPARAFCSVAELLHRSAADL